MKKLLILVTVAVIATCLMTGCGVKVLAYSDPEDTIDISPDREFIILIALESNPTTGYSWEASYDETMLELVEETYELGEYAKQDVVGAGGTELFRFKALESGEVEITMVYKRTWEEEGIDQKIFTIDVK
jgi:inhibitor of cysteine peptidase